jgi:hypothetical protein
VRRYTPRGGERSQVDRLGLRLELLGESLNGFNFQLDFAVEVPLLARGPAVVFNVVPAADGLVAFLDVGG